MNFTLDFFLTEYTNFNNNNSPFDGDECIWKNKYISDVNSHLWHHEHSPPCTNVLGSLAFRVTSKVIGIGASDFS